MREYRFSLDMPYSELIPFYEGHIRDLIVTTWGGTRVRIAFHHFRPHIGHDGLHGRFAIILDENNRLLQIGRIG
jgi:hypothetical protein